jgi:hypothetical protein
MFPSYKLNGAAVSVFRGIVHYVELVIIVLLPSQFVVSVVNVRSDFLTNIL